MLTSASRISGAFAALVGVMTLPAGSRTALAHEAPAGWDYPFACCSGYDCRPVSAKTIDQSPSGYVISNTGEIVGYADSRIRTSPDGKYHWCSVAGKNDGRTICLFVPSQVF